MKSLFSRLLALVFALSLTSVLSARVADDDFMFRHLDVRDGLTNNQIIDIHKDANGLMWIATASGLNRFDGYRVRNYMSDPDDTTTIRSNYIFQIQEDHLGNLWLKDQSGYSIMETNSGNVQRDATVYLKRHGVNSRPSTLRFDIDYNLWVATDDGYLYYLAPSAETARMLPISTNEKHGSRFTDIAANQNHVLVVDDSGRLLVIDRQQFNLKTSDNSIPEAHPERPLTDFNLRVGADSIIWVYSKDGIWQFNSNDLSLQPFDLDQYSLGDFVKDIKVDKEKRTWIALNHGGVLVLYPNGTYRHLVNDPYNERSIANNNTTSLHIGNGGTVWIGTYKRGLSYYNDAMYKFRNKHFPDVTCDIMNPEGNLLYVGTDADGLMEWNLETGETRKIPDPAEAGKRPAPIIDIFIDSNGRLWVGTFGGGGLKNYNPATGKWDYIRMSDGLAIDQVWAINQTPDGRLWIGTLGKGIQVFNPETRKFERIYNMSNSDMHSEFVSSLRPTSDGKALIVGTSVGVDIIDLSDGELRHLDGNHAGTQSFVDCNINQVMQDSRQLIWVATHAGLDVYDPQTDNLHHISFGAKVKSPFVLGVVEDDNRQIWVSVGGQLYNVIVDFDNRTRDLRYKVIGYNEMDGLAGYDFNQRTLARLPGDRIGVGGLDGINFFSPAEMKYNNKAPYVFLTDLLVNNQFIQTISGAKKIELEPNEKSFTLCFTTDDYVIPAATTFFYMLEGYDDDWIECAPDIHQVTYTNLDPGKYKFRVKAINRDGKESSDEVTLDVVVQTPWYLSGLMKTFYVLFTIILIFTILHWFRRHERRRILRREAVLRAQREEEVTNMRHNFISNITHELRYPLTLIIPPLEKLRRESRDRAVNERYDLILNNAHRLQRLVNELLDFRKVQEHEVAVNTTLADIVPFVRSATGAFGPLAAQRNVTLTFATSVKQLTMEFDVDFLEQAINYLITNALKFSPIGGKVAVDTSRRTNSFIIRITDDGAGIADEVKDKIFDRMYQTSRHDEPEMAEGTGVELMLVKEYIELQGGSVSIEDNPNGSGTRFIISLPIVGEKKGEPIQDDATAAEGDIISPVMPAQAPQPARPAAPQAAPATAAPQRAPQAAPQRPTPPPVPNPAPAAAPAPVAPGVPTAAVYSETANRAPLRRRPAPGQQATALLVDDNTDLLMFLREGLGNDFKVVTATNGEEALDRIIEEGFQPSVVVTDIMMPVMDGLELTRRLKRDAYTADIPVIMLTAKDELQAKIEGLTAGADDYITKPFNLDALILRIKKLIYASPSVQQKPSEAAPAFIDPEPHKLEITPLDTQLVDKATRYIEEHVSRSDLSVEELSAHIGMSRVHLYKKIKQITGKTPTEFIRTIRLKMARQMLAESQLNVQEIAFKLGFSSPRSFSKYFMEEFGVLPSHFQRKH